MKTIDNAFDTITSFEWLAESYRHARKRKRFRPEVLDFSSDIDANLLSIQSDLRAERFVFGPYRHHMIYVPKHRMVMALPFRSRIVQWAIYLLLNPFYDRIFIEDSFACRDGKGTLAAVQRLQYWLKEAEGKRTPWTVVKIDISKYFYRVDHELLLEILSTRIKDERLLRLLESIISCDGDRFGLPPFLGPEDVEPEDWLSDVGMPIGNLTSQLFANIFLNELDQYAKHVLRIHRYLRYMDDIVIVAPSSSQAAEWRDRIVDFLRDRLRLETNRKTALSDPGRVEFVGYIVSPRELRLRKQTARRIKRSFRGIARRYFDGRMTRSAFSRRVESYKGMIAYVTADNLKDRLNQIYTQERGRALTRLALIETLCNICSDMSNIIKQQTEALSQFDALILEKEIEDVMTRYNQAIGPEKPPADIDWRDYLVY